MRIDAAKKGGDGSFGLAESVGAGPEEQEAQTHVYCHVMPVVHVGLEMLPQYPQSSEAVHISASCHDLSRGNSRRGRIITMLIE